MADSNGKPAAENEDDWEYEDEEADDYAWEYETEEEEEGGEKSGEKTSVGKVEGQQVKTCSSPEDEEEEEGSDEGSEDDDAELPDPFSPISKTATTAPAKAKSTTNDVKNGTNGHQAANGADRTEEEENGKKKHHKKKKSRHQERIDELKAYNDKKEKSGDSRSKKIHVRSKDPLRIARQFEKADKKPSKHDRDRNSGNGSGRKPVAPPQQKINQICKICNKEPYLTERIVAEKSWWCKKCFKCSVCNKILNLDTYMSHEGIIYCKPHHKELFMPKTVRSDIIDVGNVSKQQEAVLKHQEAQRNHETIIRESNPVQRDDVIKSSTCTKWSGMEDLDVGSKFKKFEAASTEDDLPERRNNGSDRYGIMEKLKRLQDGEDLDDLLAEMDEELPSDEEEEEDEEDYYLTEVQKKTKKTEKLFSEDVKKAKKDETVRREMQALRKRLNCGGTSNKIDDFDDLLNASSHKVQKTKVDVKSENAKRFRDMFDKGEVPEEDNKKSDNITQSKNAELEQMRKSKRQHRDHFKMMEAGKLPEQKEPSKRRGDTKLLVGKLKDKPETNGDIPDADLPELASLSNRFSYFENFDEKDQTRKKSKGDVADEGGEREMARRECKATGVLNKFKDMENRVLNGEPEVPPAAHEIDKPIFTALGFLGKLPGVEDRKRPLKRFTPPRKALGGDSETESGSDYSDSEYSDSSYTSSYSASSDSDEEDETLKAIRNAQRAKALRAKFEEWEESEDAKDQMAQMAAYDNINDENGERLETAGILRKKFEALRMHEEQQNQTPPPIKAQFRPKRFK